MNPTQLTIPCIISYVHLFKPHKANPKADPKFSVQLIIDPNEYPLQQIANAEQAAIQKKWGGSPPPGLKQVLHQGDVKYPGVPEYAGKWVMSASAYEDSRPAVVDQNVQAIIDPAQIYSGCRANVAVNLFGYDTGSNGVGAGLNGVQKVADGNRLDGRPGVDQMFSQVAMPEGAPQGYPAAQQQPPAQGAPQGYPAAQQQPPAQGAPQGYPAAQQQPPAQGYPPQGYPAAQQQPPAQGYPPQQPAQPATQQQQPAPAQGEQPNLMINPQTGKPWGE